MVPTITQAGNDQDMVLPFPSISSFQINPYAKRLKL